jgi:hypothetical protein
MLPYFERSDDIDYGGYVFQNKMAFSLIEFNDISKVVAAFIFMIEGRILQQNI